MTYVVFTDLDGTFLDHKTYSYEAALPGLELLRKADIPVVFCSSKTRPEQEVLRRALGMTSPFIVEDGGAVLIEPKYFDIAPGYFKKRNGYLVLEFGESYPRIRRSLFAAQHAMGMELRGYGDATVEEVAEATGLSLEDAALARDREYEETLLTHLGRDAAQRLKEILSVLGLTLSRGGRFYSIKGQNNKGQAAMAVIKLFARERNRRIVSVGIGDSANDLPLLSVVNIPILVQRPGGGWQNLRIAGVKTVEGIGPVGWTRAVEWLLAGKL